MHTEQNKGIRFPVYIYYALSITPSEIHVESFLHVLCVMYVWMCMVCVYVYGGLTDVGCLSHSLSMLHIGQGLSLESRTHQPS